MSGSSDVLHTSSPITCGNANFFFLSTALSIYAAVPLVCNNGHPQILMSTGSNSLKVRPIQETFLFLFLYTSNGQGGI